MAFLNDLDEIAALKLVLYVLNKQNGFELGKQQGEVIKEANKNQFGIERINSLNKRLIPFIKDFANGLIAGLK